MSLIPHNPAARVGATLGFLAMCVLGWKMADQPPPRIAPQQETTAKVANRPTRHVRKSGPPEAVRQRMAAIRALGTPEERMRATIELAYNLPVSEIGAWMQGRWFITGPGFDLTLFNKILTERWNKEDPEGLLTWKLKNNLGRTGEMFAAWAGKNPDRVAAYFKDHLTKDQQLQALPEIARKNPALALQCLRELPSGRLLEDGSTSSYYTRQVLAELAKSSPAELQAALATMPTGLKNQAESLLIGQRLQSSFNDEFHQLLERPDGWKILSANLSTIKGLGDKLFDQLADLPAAWKASLASDPYNLMDGSTAIKWWNADLESIGFGESDAERIRMIALSRIASKQPEQALKLMGPGFDADTRTSVISNIFSNLEGKPEKVESLLALLSSEDEKRQAHAILDANNPTSPGKKIEKPAEWLEKAATIDLESGNLYQYLSVLREWDPDKIADLGNQFRAMPDDKKAQVAQVIASNNNSSTVNNALVGDAIRYLVAQPAPAASENQNRSREPIAQASNFAVTWAKTDPNAAGTWVQSLPAGDAKLWAQKNLAANWAQYEPKEAAQWVKSLPAGEHAVVEKFMKTGKD